MSLRLCMNVMEINGEFLVFGFFQLKIYFLAITDLYISGLFWSCDMWQINLSSFLNGKILIIFIIDNRSDIISAFEKTRKFLR